MEKHIMAGAIALSMTALGMALMVLLFERLTEKVVIEASTDEQSTGDYLAREDKTLYPNLSKSVKQA